MKLLFAALLPALPLAAPAAAAAEPAFEVVGDYTFPNAIDGMPAKLSDFEGLQINSFTTNDRVRLNYWEAGSGDPIVFVPAWGASGAELINELWLLSQTNHVYVLDPRNQGTSERTLKGQRIARHSMDLNELLDHAGIETTVLSFAMAGAAALRLAAAVTPMAGAAGSPGPQSLGAANRLSYLSPIRESTFAALVDAGVPGWWPGRAAIRPAVISCG